MCFISIFVFFTWDSIYSQQLNLTSVPSSLFLLHICFGFLRPHSCGGQNLFRLVDIKFLSHQDHRIMQITNGIWFNSVVMGGCQPVAEFLLSHLLALSPLVGSGKKTGRTKVRKLMVWDKDRSICERKGEREGTDLPSDGTKGIRPTSSGSPSNALLEKQNVLTTTLSLWGWHHMILNVPLASLGYFSQQCFLPTFYPLMLDRQGAE